MLNGSVFFCFFFCFKGANIGKHIAAREEAFVSVGVGYINENRHNIGEREEYAEPNVSINSVEI